MKIIPVQNLDITIAQNFLKMIFNLSTVQIRYRPYILSKFMTLICPFPPLWPDFIYWFLLLMFELLDSFLPSNLDIIYRRSLDTFVFVNTLMVLFFIFQVKSASWSQFFKLSYLSILVKNQLCLGYTQKLLLFCVALSNKFVVHLKLYSLTWQ